MEKANRYEGDEYVVVPVAGHHKPFYADVGINRCGHTNDGIAFQFGEEGCWVIDIADLRKLLDLAEKQRQ